MTHTKTLLATLLGAALLSSQAAAEVGAPEKEELKLGFIKLTDMAPLAVAYEKGYFEDEGLYVTLEAQANWKVLLDRVIDGQLDGAHMLAGQPIGALGHAGLHLFPDSIGDGDRLAVEIHAKGSDHFSLGANT